MINLNAFPALANMAVAVMNGDLVVAAVVTGM